MLIQPALDSHPTVTTRVPFRYRLGTTYHSSTLKGYSMTSDNTSSNTAWFAECASKRIKIQGSTMNVLEVGVGEPVVLGSSYLWDRRMWRYQIEALSKRYRVIVPELWGHGGS